MVIQTTGVQSNIDYKSNIDYCAKHIGAAHQISCPGFDD